jgi:thiol-disulfide isomerase/thioredoxin
MGLKTNISNVRSIKGVEMPQLARALGGSGTLFNIWASWGGSCKGELPIVSKLANEYSSKGLRVTLVSVDEPEDQPRLVDIAQGFGFGSPIWVAARPLSEFKRALAQNWKGNIPVTFLYDAHGKRRYFWDGPVELHELRPIVDDFLGGKDVAGEKHYSLAPGLTDEH